jgi:hypothetical protein
MSRLGVVMLCAAVAAAACGGFGGRQNRMLSSPIGLMKLRAAHEPVYVRAEDGAWTRVWIDTGATDDWAPAGTLVTSADGSVRVLEVDGQYIVYDDERGRRVLGSVEYLPAHAHQTMSPDGRWFAFAWRPAVPGEHEAETFEVVVVSTIDLAVRRVESKSPSIALRWLGDELWFESPARWHRIDPATGAVDDPADVPTALGLTDEDCPAVGLRLQLDDSGGRRRLVVVPIASTANPEQLATADNRVLVSAETGKTHWPHGGPVPEDLWGGVFTQSCKHFAFLFGDDIYVGDVADGRFARLTHGDRVSGKPPGQ